MNIFVNIDKDFFNELYFKYNIQIELLDDHDDFYFHVENDETETTTLYTSQEMRLLDFDNIDQDIKVYDFYKFIYYQIYKHIEKQFLLGEKK